MSGRYAIGLVAGLDLTASTWFFYAENLDAVWQAMMKVSGRRSDLADLRLGPMAKALAHELMTLHIMLQATPNSVDRSRELRIGS